MKETNLLAAVLTVAFYTGRGAAMGLPQIIATYHEMRDLLTEESRSLRRAKPRRPKRRRRR